MSEKNPIHPTHLEPLTWPELRMLLWHEIGGRPLPFSHDEAKAISVRLRDAHGLLSSVSTGEGAGSWAPTADGRALVGRVRALAQDLTKAQRQHLLDFAAGCGWAGRGRSVALKSLASLGLAHPKHGWSPSSGRYTVVTPLGLAVAEVCRG